MHYLLLLVAENSSATYLATYLCIKMNMNIYVYTVYIYMNMNICDLILKTNVVRTKSHRQVKRSENSERKTKTLLFLVISLELEDYENFLKNTSFVLSVVHPLQLIDEEISSNIKANPCVC